MNKSLYKDIPSVDEIIKKLSPKLLNIPRNLIKLIIRNCIKKIKLDIKNNRVKEVKKYTHIIIKEELNKIIIPSIRSVINGTGIILHTGLGRAPISKKIFKQSMDSIYPYTNLEFNLNNGDRGERNHHIDYLINAITGSESSMVVNNNAAAVLLALNTLSESKDVIISRGQQVEIGGSFRIPDVINKSNCNMIEVGTTNKTHLKDYENVIQKKTGAILYAHTSNYKVIGFTHEVSVKDLSQLAKKHNIPTIVDLGSGALIDFSKMNLPFENLVKSYVKSGASVVTFSGDKLIGGPQCGIICGSEKLINKIQKNPLYRALRCDKFTLSLLEQSLRTFKTDYEVDECNMTISLLNRNLKELASSGEKIMKNIPEEILKNNNIELVQSKVEAGSGSLPTKSIDSYAIKIQPNINVNKLSASFRSSSPAIIGYINKGMYFIDLKAIPNDQINTIYKTIIDVLS